MSPIALSTIACTTLVSSRGAANMATERTSARASSGFATSSAKVIPLSPKSRISPPSDTAGAGPARSRTSSWSHAARRIGASLTLKLVALVGIFVALPIVLYGQFESADRQTRELVTRAIQDRSTLIARALTPSLKNMDPSSQASLNADLAKYSSDGTILKLMFQPGAEHDAGRFFFM